MSRCSDCRKQQADLTWWESIRLWFFSFFSENISDLSADKFTQGFGEGYTKANEHGGIEKTIDASLKRIESRLEHMDKPKKAIEIESSDPMLVISAEKIGKEVILKLAGETLMPDKVDMLKQEARTLLNGELWRIMQETVKSTAINQFLVKGESWEDAIKGKAMIHNLELMKSMVDAIEKAT